MTTILNYLTNEERDLFDSTLRGIEDGATILKKLVDRSKDRIEQEQRLLQLAEDIENDSR